MATNLGVEHLQYFDPIPSLYPYGEGFLYPVLKVSVRQGWYCFGWWLVLDGTLAGST